VTSSDSGAGEGERIAGLADGPGRGFRSGQPLFETREPTSTDKNAALIAEHCEPHGSAGSGRAHRRLVARRRHDQHGDARRPPQLHVRQLPLASRPASRLPDSKAAGVVHDGRGLGVLIVSMARLVEAQRMHVRLPQSSWLASEGMRLLKSIDAPALRVARACRQPSPSLRPETWPRSCAARKMSSTWPMATVNRQFEVPAGGQLKDEMC
jgi:hypothetical protein